MRTKIMQRIATIASLWILKKMRKQTHDPGGTKCSLLVFQAVPITGYIGGVK